MGSSVVLLGLIGLSKRMMKAFFVVVATGNNGDGDDDDDYDTGLLSQMMMRTYSSTHANGPELRQCARHVGIDLYTFLGSKLPRKVEKSLLICWWLCQVV